MKDIRSLKHNAMCMVEVVRPFGLGKGKVAKEGEEVQLRAEDALMVIAAQKAIPGEGYHAGEGEGVDEEDFEEADYSDEE